MNGLLPVSLMPGAPTPVTREIERVVDVYVAVRIDEIGLHDEAVPRAAQVK